MNKTNLINRLVGFIIFFNFLIFGNCYSFTLEQARFGIGKLSPRAYIKDVYKDKIKLPTDSSKSLTFSYSIENIPFIPDIKLSYFHLNSSSKSTVKNNYEIYDLTLNVGDSLLAKVLANNVKLTLYTQPLDKFNYDFLNLNLGLNLNFIDYTVKIKNLTLSQEEDKEISTLVPSLYLSVSVSPTYYITLSLNTDLPFGAKKREKNIDFEFKYYLNSQVYAFYNYGYKFLRVNKVNDSDFKITGHMMLVGLGLLW